MNRRPTEEFMRAPRPLARRTAALAALAAVAALVATWAWPQSGGSPRSPAAPGAAVTITLPGGNGQPVLPQMPQMPQLPDLPPASITVNVGVAAPAPASAAAPPAATRTEAIPTAAVKTTAPRPSGVESAPPAAPTGSAGPLEFATAQLPSVRVGSQYGPMPLVRNGGRMLVFDLSGNLADSGLELTQSGVLRGVATRAGDYRFTVTLVGAPGVSTPLRQTFTLRVRPARVATPAVASAAASAAAPAAARALPAAPVKPATLPLAVVERLPAMTTRPHALSWKLATAELGKLAAEAVADATDEEDKQTREEGWEPLRGAEPSASAAEAGAKTLAKLQGLLPGLVDVEYPTHALFKAALAAQERAVCLRAEAEAARRAGRPPLASACSAAPDNGAAAAPGDSAAELTPRQAQQVLLPPSLVRAVAERAELPPHDLDSALPLRWTGAGCGCAPAQSENFRYGVVPFWLPQKEVTHEVDFSAYTRIGYLGALLADDGSLLLAKPWNEEDAAGLRRALAHNVALDLVLYRRDWAPLLAATGAMRTAMLRRTAQELMARVDTPLQAWWRPLQRLALPLWPLPTHLYSGVTLFFDGLDELDELPASPSGQQYLVDLVSEIVSHMERSQRRYALNVVLKAERLIAGDAGGGVATAVRLLERTGSIAPAGQAGLGTAANPLAPKVNVHFLVLLPEPTTDTKKQLRAALDRNSALQSHQRVDFLKSLIPMVMHPAGDKPARMAPELAFQFDADLAYHGWQYGGAGLWPLALQDRGTGAQAIELLHANFRANERWWRDRWSFTNKLCTWVCPYRTWWRLGLNSLLLLGAVSLGLYLFNCRVRERGGRAFVIWLWSGLLLTGAVFWLMLTCDPDLNRLSESNKPLVALFGAVLLVTLWFLTQRKAPKP